MTWAWNREKLMFDPDWSVHPGETIREALEERNMSQSYLAFATGYSLKHVNRVVQGHDRVSPAFALAVEREIDVPAHVLVRIQADFDLWIERQGAVTKGDDRLRGGQR